MHRTLDESKHGVGDERSGIWKPFATRGVGATDARTIRGHEDERLAELSSFRVLDTPAEACFDELTAIAASVCRKPIATVSLVDGDREWSKSHHGRSWPGADNIPRSMSLCSDVIKNTQPLVVEDASLDSRFQHNPLVTGTPGIRFYAGAPLLTSEGFAIGAICVMDVVSGEVTDLELQQLVRLARVCVDLLERSRRERQNALASRTRSELLDSMSREIRGPLNGVLGTARLLSDTPLDADQRQLVGSLSRSGEQLLTLSTNVHEYAQLEAGRIELQSVAFDLKTLVADAAETVSAQAREKKLDLTVVWNSRRTPARVGDPQRLQQVFVNLLSNAVKFTNTGAVSIAVADSLSPTGVAVTISDTGIGIEPELIDSVFDIFGNPGDASACRHDGARIGLALCKQLVTLMRGSIAVESKPGVGTRFTLQVPLAIGAMPAVGDSSNQPFDLSGRTILVAEDDPISALVVQHLLKRRGAEVEVAANGQLAIAACRTRSYDALLMDCVMPEMDGYAATRWLRSNGPEWCAAVPIIALTVNALDGDRQRSLAAGMSDYLTKPVRPEALETALRRAMETAQAVVEHAKSA